MNNFSNKFGKILGNLMVGLIIFVILGAIIYSIFNEGLVSTIRSMLFGSGFRGQQYLQGRYD